MTRSPLIWTMDTAALLAYRTAKDEFFGSDHSPLPHHLVHGFAGLAYYPPNPELVFTVPLREADGAQVTVQTSDGAQRTYLRAATVELPIGDEPVTLTLYADSPGYFIPFRDATSGKTTYGAGRYLEVDPNPDGTVTIDFNLAYNPFCAYDDAYSCPLPPVENWVRVPIEAGEKTFAP